MNISFFLTQAQFEARTKTETRRIGWNQVAVGDVLTGIVKGQGLKRGERVQRLHDIRVKQRRREPLNQITQASVIAEGFPELTPAQFVAMFCRHNRCLPDKVITVIVFEHLE